MKRSLLALLTLLPLHNAFGFCGFYVAKADASLYNQASQVVLVRNENKTALTMFADYKGDLKEFALIVPVPTVLKKEQIAVADRGIVEHLDAYSAPRLVEYFDRDPCLPEPPRYFKDFAASEGGGRGGIREKVDQNKLGVKIEAKYTVGEYDILILSAEQSDGLETWLTQNGYKVPKNAAKALQPYIKQNLKFFVAKVNIREQAKTGFTYLRPIQFAYESRRFMLPIRLGMVNSDGPQDMLIYAITRKGRVETTNYRTVKLPTGQSIPTFVKNDFPNFYKSMFKTAWEKDNKKIVLTEYVWNMSWCDPCAADPLSNAQLRKLGVWWVPEDNVQQKPFPPGLPVASTDAMVTRLHVRYDAEHFPEDLMFQETSDDQNYQGRYVMNHPFTGEAKCPQAEVYKNSLKQRFASEAEALAHLTGWPIADIYKKMGSGEGLPKGETKQWYEKIFK